MSFPYDMLVHGVSIVCARQGEAMRGLAVAWASQAGTDHVVLSIGSQSATREFILDSGAFGMSILASDQLELARRFGALSSRETDKLAGVQWHAGETGAPLLDRCLATIDCRVAQVHDLGDLKLIVGRVVGYERRSEGRPLLFRGEDY
ncbi:MAG: hypothetical protein GF405_02280 [Candidatus Eisenbacteria bacterium]|nr:hypothetical protein [Candidatus Eisenbacteria bacterium]